MAGSGKPAEQCTSSTLGMILQENPTAAEEVQAFAYTASSRTGAEVWPDYALLICPLISWKVSNQCKVCPLQINMRD